MNPGALLFCLIATALAAVAAARGLDFTAFVTMAIVSHQAEQVFR